MGRWPPTANVPAPSINPDFQKCLIEVFGSTPDGRPKLRVVWGQEATEFYHEQNRLRYPCAKQRRFVAWGVPITNPSGQVSGWKKWPPTTEPPSHAETGGGMVMRLMEQTLIGTPRWFIEQWMGPRNACRDWDENRWEWKYDPIQGIHRRVDMLGPAPWNGFYPEAPYTYPFMISVHQSDGLCCVNKRKAGFRCYGQYRDPDSRDLEYIAMLVREQAREPYLYDYDQLPPREVIEADVREKQYLLGEQERKDELYCKEMLADDIRPHTKRLLTEGGRLDKEKYHFTFVNPPKPEPKENNA